ncbi:lactate/malate family dehydrogenase [Sphingobium yanoikuyae]|uniref:lactate/malate family dehydrogenase n=1 Tax=Sphingobium yanoikuyae TaxID=13690 RepID=UPI000847628F|nr:L-lactate dehydrogenase [Sphingobium yanoikuyae]
MAVRFDKVAIIGTGHVGATAAYAMMLRGLFTQILLIDADGPRAQAEALDIADANALARPAHVLRGDYRDAGDAAIVVITAGATTHGEESRLSVAGRSAAIVADCARRVVEAGFAGVMIVASNPVDAMAQVAQRASGLPVGQVIGTGTLLDSARFRRRLADRLGVAPVSVEGQVLGEHGDSEVAVFSGVRIGGVTLDQFRGGAVLDRAELAHETMRAGYAINYGKGHTSYGVATAIVRLCEAVRRDEQVVLPVSTLAHGECGVAGAYLSLPCVIGALGVSRVLAPDLDAEERAALRVSAAVLQGIMDGLESH